MAEFIAVKPLSGAAPYLGGKKNLADRIIERIELVDHRCYVEPFIGMGGVFFRRKLIPPCEIFNDYSGEVVNFFRVIQRHYRALLDELRFTLAGRSIFHNFIDTPPESLTDIQRAARFYYLQHCGFSGKVGSTCFAVDRYGNSRFNIRQLRGHIEKLHERLSNVTIENLPYSTLIERYDSPETLFYLDPPYYGCENDYGKNLFEREDFNRLSEQLATITGKFILSLNDRPQVREIFACFNMEEVSTNYGIGGNQKFEELLISNFELNHRQPALF